MGRRYALLILCWLFTLACSASGERTPSQQLNAPPVFQTHPIPNYDENLWCNTPGSDALSGPLTRAGLLLLAVALLLSRLFAPTAQPLVITVASTIICVLSSILLTHAHIDNQTTPGEHPLALELFLLALPSWLILLCTSPLRVPSLITSLNTGAALTAFGLQTLAIFLLSSTQVYLSATENRYIGMDTRHYELTRNRNSDLKRVYDSPTQEYVFQGENLCGRRATFGTTKIHLDSPHWNNFMIVWAVIAMVIWIIFAILWCIRMLKYHFYIRNSSNNQYPTCFMVKSKIEIKDSFPAIAQLHTLFRDGEIPARTPVLPEKLKDLELGLSTTRVGKFCRYKLNFQFPVLSRLAAHLEFYYGLANPVNLPYFAMLLRLILFVLVVQSTESTILDWNILFGVGPGIPGKEGDFSANMGYVSGMVERGGGLVLATGALSILHVMNSWIGEKGYWRIVGVFVSHGATRLMRMGPSDQSRPIDGGFEVRGGRAGESERAGRQIGGMVEEMVYPENAQVDMAIMYSNTSNDKHKVNFSKAFHGRTGELDFRSPGGGVTVLERTRGEDGALERNEGTWQEPTSRLMSPMRTLAA
ncbi:hypothetical protein BDZ91DRAFT_792279 [Kalaharituber pfeilii]|nr:hypothetical protein BDZ91DRAFT_792279 [Kalaharituber pfeilii]